jgi:hypothetical protein
MLPPGRVRAAMRRRKGSVAGDDHLVAALPRAARSAGSEIFGSFYRMMYPADGRKGALKFVLDCIKDSTYAGKTCPPNVLGIGIGGTADVCIKMAKEAGKPTLTEVADADPDQNRIPAPLNVIIQAGQQWRASYFLMYSTGDNGEAGFDFRNVAIARLNPPAKQLNPLGITVSPEPGVFVTAPSFDQLVAAGVMSDGEEGYLIVNSSVALQLMVDAVYGVGDTDLDKFAWADSVDAAAPPGGRVPWSWSEGGPSPFVEIGVLAINAADDTYRDIEQLPDTLPVELELIGLEVDGETPVQVWSYLSWLQDSNPGALDFFWVSPDAAAGIYEWEFVE